MNKGFVKIPNAIFASGAASEDELLGLYIRLSAAVNWKVGWFKRKKIEPGQMAFSWREIQSRLYPTAKTPPDIKTIRRRLSALQEMGLVRFENIANRYSVLTILGVGESPH